MHGQEKIMYGKNRNLYFLIGAWPIIALVMRAHSELEWPKAWSHGPPLTCDGSMSYSSSSNKSRKWCPFPSNAWKVIFHRLVDSSQSVFLQKSQEILDGYNGVTKNDFESLSTSWWNLYLSLLGHSQNSIEFDLLDEKNVHNSWSIAAEWIWYWWEL